MTVMVTDDWSEKEMTGHFTFPFRPQLPPGHPGYGLPLPKDSEKKQKRLDAMFGWIDKNRDGFWDKEEFLKNLTIGRGKPLLVAVKPGGAGNVTDSHIQWEFNKGIPEVPSPILYDDLIYMVSNGGVLTCLNAGVGQMVYRKRLRVGSVCRLAGGCRPESNFCFRGRFALRG